MQEVTPEGVEESANGEFPATRWSLISSAQRDGETATAALNELCRTYWFPIYAFARDVRGLEHHEAEDSAQEFIASLLHYDFLHQIDADKGRFRSFLCQALRNFLNKELRKKSAQKRGGGEQPLSLEQIRAEEWYEEEQTRDLSPEALFDRRWLWTVLQRGMDEMAAWSERRDKVAEFSRRQKLVAS